MLSGLFTKIRLWLFLPNLANEGRKDHIRNRWKVIVVLCQMGSVQRGRPTMTKDNPSRKPNDLLRYEREKRGWSQNRLAELIGADPTMISRWECGERKPSSFYQEKLCNLFDRDAIELGLVEQRKNVQPAQTATPSLVLQPLKSPSTHDEQTIEISQDH